jgi:hypothetical protein
MHKRKLQLPERWLTDVVNALQKANFINSGVNEGADLPAVIEWIQESIYINRDSYSKSFYNPATYDGEWTAEQEIAALDKSRVWIIDTEVDFEPSDYWHVRTLLDWARISRGCFDPQCLTELWAANRKLKSPHIDQAIQVKFKIKGNPFSFTTTRKGGWFDYDLIRVVNRAIQDTGCQFASVAFHSGGQSAYVCCLTKQELNFLRNKRGWQFHDHLFSTEA